MYNGDDDMQRNDLEQKRTEALNNLTSKYKEIMNRYNELTQKINIVNEQLNEKQARLDQQKKNIDTAVNSKDLAAINSRKQTVKASVGLEIAEDPLNDLFNSHENKLNEAYKTLQKYLAKEKESLLDTTLKKRVEPIAATINAKYRDVMTNIQTAQSPEEIQNQIAIFQHTVQKCVLEINMTQGSLGDYSDVYRIDTTLSEPARSARECNEEMTRQILMLQALETLATIKNLQKLSDASNQQTLSNKIGDLQKSPSSNTYAFIDTNTNKKTSISVMLNNILGNNEKINTANVKKGSTDDLLQEQIALAKTRGTTHETWEKQQEYSNLILHFKAFQKELDEKSNRLEPVKNVIKWLELQQSQKNPEVKFEDAKKALATDPNFAIVVKPKVIGNKVAVEELRSILSEKYHIGLPDKTMKNTKPANTHKQVLQKMQNSPPQKVYPNATAVFTKKEIEQIRSDLEEAKKMASHIQPQQQVQPPAPETIKTRPRRKN
jgi:hypothetical protein